MMGDGQKINHVCNERKSTNEKHDDKKVCTNKEEKIKYVRFDKEVLHKKKDERRKNISMLLYESFTVNPFFQSWSLYTVCPHSRKKYFTRNRDKIHLTTTWRKYTIDKDSTHKRCLLSHESLSFEVDSNTIHYKQKIFSHKKKYLLSLVDWHKYKTSSSSSSLLFKSLSSNLSTYYFTTKCFDRNVLLLGFSLLQLQLGCTCLATPSQLLNSEANCGVCNKRQLPICEYWAIACDVAMFKHMMFL